MSTQTSDFFQRQDMARKRTTRLLVLFSLAVLCIIVALYAVALLLLGGPVWNPEMLGGTALLVAVVVLCGSLYKIAALSKGGPSVAELLGGRAVDPGTADPSLRQLINITEEMAIAAGIPVPALYVLPDEQGINAFAAGFSTSDAAVGITLGALKRLNRDEVQGVIAHEFSHILNGDMRLNIRLMGVLFGILCLAILGRVLLRAGWLSSARSSSREKNGGAAVFVVGGMALFVIGSVGVFFARLIQAAVSRQREFLADAAAVQFTRNPEGIAGALYKIGRYSGVLQSPRAEEASHLFFGNGLPESWISLFSTHPPLTERIAAIHPGFDPENVKLIRVPAKPVDGKAAPVPRNWIGHAGNPGEAQIAEASALLSALPAETRTGLREIESAKLLLYAMLLDSDPALRGRQLGVLADAGVPIAEVEALHNAHGSPGSAEKITMVDLAIPALRHMDRESYSEFRRNLDAMIGADDSVNLFEYLLTRMLRRHLDRFFNNAKPPPVRFRGMRPVLGDIAVLLSALAHLGNRDPEKKQRAFEEGVRELMVNRDDPALQKPGSPGVMEVDAALERLEQTEMSLRRQVLLACGQTVMSDGMVAEGEAQLLRAIADALDCPVPPFVRDSAQPSDES